MEVVNAFFNKFKVQIKEIYEKEKKGDDSIILVNYENPEDIKVTCTTIDTIEPRILIDLENIKKKTSQNNNENLAIIMNKKNINIVKYQ
tara:strand:- start:1703 stop:1969 length:267 start_codon:yes stop_codon:yes gene_type:complete